MHRRITSLGQAFRASKAASFACWKVFLSTCQYQYLAHPQYYGRWLLINIKSSLKLRQKFEKFKHTISMGLSLSPHLIILVLIKLRIRQVRSINVWFGWCQLVCVKKLITVSYGLRLIMETTNVTIGSLLCRHIGSTVSKFKILLWANRSMKPFETWPTCSLYWKKSIAHFFGFLLLFLRVSAKISGPISLNGIFLKNGLMNFIEIWPRASPN